MEFHDAILANVNAQINKYEHMWLQVLDPEYKKYKDLLRFRKNIEKARAGWFGVYK